MALGKEDARIILVVFACGGGSRFEHDAGWHSGDRYNWRNSTAMGSIARLNSTDEVQIDDNCQ
jgi:hypothetical protein